MHIASSVLRKAFRSVSQRIHGRASKCTPATTERLTFFSFLRVEYIAPLFSSLRYLLVRNINAVAVYPSTFISLLTTFKFGKKRAYDFGLLLRDRYNSFLGGVYYPPNIYARSTEVIRCKMTLQLVLAALYPPIDIQKWHSELSWQPIDLIYVSPHEDDLLFPFGCET